MLKQGPPASRTIPRIIPRTVPIYTDMLYRTVLLDLTQTFGLDDRQRNTLIIHVRY